MAFNPFSAFQKNQKIWMAGVLLISMITFVFCTGMGGMDIGERFIRYFSKRGATVVTVGGYNLSLHDLTRMRTERALANDFMRKCADLSIANINKKLQEVSKKTEAGDPKKAKEREEFMVQLAGMRFNLLEKLRRPRFFEGGVKLDDLVEFKTWQVMADRLQIRLLDEEIDLMVRLEFFSPRYEVLEWKQIAQAQDDVRRFSSDTSDTTLRRALMEEFRVRIAQLALLEMQPSHFFAGKNGLPLLDTPDEVRLQATLAQIWKVYQEKRADMDVTLIPVHVDDFAAEVFKEKGPPDHAELEKLFERYRKNPYDPTAPVPSFQSPQQVKVEFVMADPTSPIYRGAAKATLTLEALLPLAGSPLESPLVAAVRAGAAGAAKQTVLHDVREGLSRPKQFELYRTADLGSPHFIWPMAAHFAQKDPRAAASLVGNVTASLGNPVLPGAAAWAGFLAQGTVGHPDALAAGLAAEVKRRTKPYAMIAASGAIGTPAGMAAVAYTALKLQPLPGGVYSEPLLLPAPIVEPDLENTLEGQIAERWATRNLMAIKKQLDKSTKPEAIKRIVHDYVPRYHLTHVITKGYYDRYNVDQAPELKPLRAAYEKYYPLINLFEKRDLTPERLLKDTDFDKLFFGSERFASTTKYQIRPWPPEIFPNPVQVELQPGANLMPPDVPEKVVQDLKQAMQQQDPNRPEGYKLLDTAQKPALFWRADEKPAEFPPNLAAARDRVVRAWKQEMARELKALPLAKKIADDLVERGDDFPTDVLQKLARQAGHEPITLTKVAPWVSKQIGGNNPFGGSRDYFPYKLPRGMIDTPRADTVGQLLALYNPKAPFVVKTELKEGEPAFVKQLNDLNKGLFDAVKKEKNPKGKFVQVLTNKPMTVYYVAVVTTPPTANPKEFQENAVPFASQNQFRPVDLFFRRAQEQLAREFRARFLAALRGEIGYTPATDQDRQSFDSSEH